MKNIISKRYSTIHKAIKPKTTKLLIDGNLVNSASGKTFETVNPSTEKIITSV